MMFAGALSCHTRPIRVNVVNHKGVGSDFAAAVTIPQMRMVRRKIIMAMRHQFGIA